MDDDTPTRIGDALKKRTPSLMRTWLIILVVVLIATLTIGITVWVGKERDYTLDQSPPATVKSDI